MVVRGLTTIYLVGGLGVEVHPNSLREVLILPRKIFCGVELKGKSTDRNQEHVMKCELEQKIRDFFFLLLQESFGPVSSKLC
jgi:hypothetical protein